MFISNQLQNYFKNLQFVISLTDIWHVNLGVVLVAVVVQDIMCTHNQSVNHLDDRVKHQTSCTQGCRVGVWILAQGQR